MKALKVKDSLQEGVGDKYAAKFGIPDDTEERKVQGTDEQIISRDGDWKLLKNPRSLDSLGSSVRGVIIPSGDIYIENFSEKIHHDLLKILYEKGILDGVFTKKWGSQLPTESGFLTIQRYKNSDDIAIGESNKLLYNEKEFKCRVDLPMITMSNGTTFQRYNTYGVGGVVFSKIPFTQVSEITPEIDQIMKEAIFQESLSSPESDKIAITSTSKDKIVYIGDSIFSVKKSPIQTKLPKIYTKNTRKPLIPTQWLTTLLIISGAFIVGIAILMRRKSTEDYEDDNY